MELTALPFNREPGLQLQKESVIQQASTCHENHVGMIQAMTAYGPAAQQFKFQRGLFAALRGATVRYPEPSISSATEIVHCSKWVRTSVSRTAGC